MKKDSIVQFVGFVTNLELDVFAPQWEQYAKKLDKKHESILQQAVAQTKNRFRYISQHQWTDLGSNFTFMNERKSEHFPEQNVKVVQAGGYTPIQFERKHSEESDDTRLVAFLGHNETDIDFYRQLPHLSLNIYQAFYESCLYGYVMEFFVDEKNADELLQQLKQRSGVETCMYKDCLVPHM